MIYFQNNKEDHIFVHIPKTGGKSIRESILNNINNSEDIKFTGFSSICKKKINVKDRNITHTRYHLPISYINPLLKIKNIKYISIIRNPWVRMFSLYQHTMMRRVPNSNNFGTTLSEDSRFEFSKTFKDKSLQEMNTIGSKNVKESFKFWLYFIGKNIKIIPQNNANLNILPQLWWLVDENNTLTVDRIFKYENFNEIEDYLNIKLIYENRSIFKSNEIYKYAYDDDAKEYVANLDKWIIEKYDYRFE